MTSGWVVDISTEASTFNATTGVTYWNGVSEEPVILSIWDGTTEHAIATVTQV